MMPIFFHLESHLWVGYLFIVNGLMLTWLLRTRFASFQALTLPFEAQVLSAFFISIGVNGLILLALDLLSLSFSLAKWPLLLIGVGLLCSIYRVIIRPKRYSTLRFEIHYLRLILYVFVFVVLFYNGALIEQITDSWWHMSLANKISLESTYSPSVGHLVGMPTRYYPPLWHGNLALAQQLSGISLPVFWNSATAWVGVFKVMAFYLFAFGISKNKGLALLAAILFVLLPGVGVSYLRVSAWPSHIAYTAWYAMFYVFTLLLDDLPSTKASLKQDVLTFLSDTSVKLTALLVLIVIVFFTHQAEVLWFAVAWLSYLVAASLSRLLSTGDRDIPERDHYFLRFFYRGFLLLLTTFSIWLAANDGYLTSGFNDQLLVYSLPGVLFFILFYWISPLNLKRSYEVCYLFSFALILCSINYTHLYSLFVPEFALPKGQFSENAAAAIGYLGGELKVPNWGLQLRGGLLYSGILSILVAIIAIVVKPTKLSILMAGASGTAIVFCLSPYLYHWLQAALAYHSTWRISLIIFHPIIWAFVLVELNDLRTNSGRLSIRGRASARGKASASGRASA